jgi:hypothetical protein
MATAIEPWIQQLIDESVAKLNAVPPPWTTFPDSHPYSIQFRMGAGETHMIVWQAWWRAMEFDEAAALNYLRRFPPPPRWLLWVVWALWDLEPWQLETDVDPMPYLSRLEDWGLGSKEDFEQDIDDPKWLSE